MPIQDLYETLLDIRGRIADSTGYLAVDERRTRQLLIDPLLASLGWDLTDPEQVEIEPRIEHSASSGAPRADYALRTASKRLAYVEAKKLGYQNLATAAEQATMYANTDGIDYAVVTDGDRWTLYDVFKKEPVPKRKIVEFQISNDSLVDCALQSLAFWRNTICEAGEPGPGHKPIVDCPPPNGNLIDLTDSDLEVTGTRPPNCLVDHTGQSHEISKWIEFYVTFVNALIDDRKLNKADCPVKLKPGNKKCIINDKPSHPHDRPFRRPLQLSKGLFLEGNVGAYNCYRNSQFLARTFLDPQASVKLGFPTS